MSDDFDFTTGRPSDEMSEYIQMFVDETSEQLDDLVNVLLVLETQPDSPSHLNESFRLIHSIKGAAAMMGLDSITLLTHHLENHFEHLRSGIEILDKSMMNLILRCVDFLRGAVDTLRQGKPLVSAPELIELLSKTFAEIRMEDSSSFVSPSAESDGIEHGVGNGIRPKANRIDASSSSSSTPLDDDTSSPPHALNTGTRAQKRIIVYFDRSIGLPELKAELIIARLSDLAIVNRTSPDIDSLACLVDLRTLQVWIETSSSDAALRSAADIVGVDLVEIDNMDSELSTSESETIPEPSSTHPSLSKAPQMAVEQSVANDVSIASELSMFEPPTGQLDGNAPAVSEAAGSLTSNSISSSSSHLKEQTTAPIESQSKVVETLRVDISRLDRLMNLAGELVVNRARFVQLASQMNDTFKKSGLISHLRDLCELLQDQPTNHQKSSGSSKAGHDDRYTEIRSTVAALEEQLQILERGRRSFLQLNEAIDQFSRVSDGLQRGVLDTRMVPIGPLFNRFKRTVRDISSELGKKVNLIIRGENTELDKRMIDELGDPLVHLVRNAIDHGLESESVRQSRGKPESGTLTLEAVHSGNSVLITISDDGGGINIEKVKRRAIERYLVTASEAETMSQHDISQFIWAPGFSTAEVVSDISGRGVGMDIVKTRIGELNGTIEVDSTFGVGTRFVIRLPLTLAIIRSLLFQLEQGIFAAPIENVREIVSVRDQDILSVHGRDSIEVRGEFIPLVRIDDIFDWHQTHYSNTCPVEFESEGIAGTTSVLILISGTKSMGLIVSELKGCQDIVVKSLDENFTYIRGLAGASILGDGSVCLLLDVVSCLELTRQRLQDRSRTRTSTSP